MNTDASVANPVQESHCFSVVSVNTADPATICRYPLCDTDETGADSPGPGGA
jgi:hypothetical protein